MNAQAGLMDAIRADPDSDELRLILADWLDDHDQAERGELIRLQVVLARLPEHHELRPEIEARVRGLLLLHQAEWVGSSDGAWEFRRGFPEMLRAASERLVGGQQLAGRFVRELWLQVGDPDHLVTLARDPALGGVQTLALVGDVLEARTVATLRDSPNLAGVVDLRLRYFYCSSYCLWPFWAIEFSWASNEGRQEAKPCPRWMHRRPRPSSTTPSSMRRTSSG